MRCEAFRQHVIARKYSRKTPLYNCLLDGEAYGTNKKGLHVLQAFDVVGARGMLGR
jgi:hypothetical protein